MTDVEFSAKLDADCWSLVMQARYSVDVEVVIRALRHVKAEYEITDKGIRTGIERPGRFSRFREIPWNSSATLFESSLVKPELEFWRAKNKIH